MSHARPIIPVVNVKQPVENEVDGERDVDVMQCAGLVTQRVIGVHQEVDHVRGADHAMHVTAVLD